MSLTFISTFLWLADYCFSGGKISGGICSVSGVLLITPFLPIIFNKFNRFQQQAETETETETGQSREDKRDYQRVRAQSTQYEVNESLIKEKTRRFTIG